MSSSSGQIVGAPACTHHSRSTSHPAAASRPPADDDPWPAPRPDRVMPRAGHIGTDPVAVVAMPQQRKRAHRATAAPLRRVPCCAVPVGSLAGAGCRVGVGEFAEAGVGVVHGRVAFGVGEVQLHRDAGVARPAVFEDELPHPGRGAGRLPGAAGLPDQRRRVRPFGDHRAFGGGERAQRVEAVELLAPAPARSPSSGPVRRTPSSWRHRGGPRPPRGRPGNAGSSTTRSRSLRFSRVRALTRSIMNDPNPSTSHISSRTAWK